MTLPDLPATFHPLAADELEAATILKVNHLRAAADTKGAIAVLAESLQTLAELHTTEAAK